MKKPTRQQICSVETFVPDVADYIRALEEQARKAHIQIRKLVSEIDFVISGGDNPCERCGECGLAGIGMLRDERKNAVELLKEIE